MNIQKALIYALIGLATTAATLVILSIWGVDLDEALYKLLGTVGVLILLVGFLLVIKSDFTEHKRLKDENYLD